MARTGKVRVLVVDDDKQRVEVFQRCLSSDFDVVEATPGLSATRLMESEHFDLLVSDKRGPTGIDSGTGFVGACPSTRSLLDAIEGFGAESGDVLVTGEAGSGKARVARSLHQATRGGGAFLCLRLAELAPGQIEAAIFDKARAQSLAAERGTLFIDGVERMSHELQARLVADRDQSWAGWRIVCATAEDPSGLHPLLLQHLGARVIELLPLRDRGEDIPPLAGHFVAQASRRLGRRGISLSREAMAELCVYNWPGNVSELREVIEQAVPRCSDLGEIGPGLLREGKSPIVGQVVDDIIGGSRGLDAAMAELEAAVIREALQQQRGNRSAAARQLKLPRQTLQDRMKKHGLWQS